MSSIINQTTHIISLSPCCFHWFIHPPTAIRGNWEKGMNKAMFFKSMRHTNYRYKFLTDDLDEKCSSDITGYKEFGLLFENQWFYMISYFLLHPILGGNAYQIMSILTKSLGSPLIPKSAKGFFFWTLKRTRLNIFQWILHVYLEINFHFLLGK